MNSKNSKSGSGESQDRKSVPLLVVAGPTGSGKSRIAAEAARELNGEIVCADSRQLYRGIAVASAQPDSETLRMVPHHLYAVLDTAEPCSAGRFRDLAEPVLDQIVERGRLPFLVGGTGFYLKAALGRASLAPPAGSDTVATLSARASMEGSGKLWDELAERDPVSAKRIHRNDGYRIVRALAILADTGKAASSFAKAGDGRPHVFVALKVPRPVLVERLDARCARMVAGGALDEARLLLARALPPKTPVLRAIGFPHLFAHLEGRLSLDRALERMRADTRQYAKQQMTWLRSQPNVRWVDASDQRAAAAELVQIASGC
ncbi:MAG: tRNA (adenosine(37)-N6)-dimethylallyltransferase MiaA [Candidatus Coatesbacteria bacterium]